MISENQANGVDAENGGKVTVAKAEEDMAQTVCKYEGDRGAAGAIIGIPRQKIHA